MLSANYYNTYEYSLNNARVVVGVNYVLEVFRNQLNKVLFVFKVIVLLLVGVLGFPLYYLFGGWLLYARRRFQRRMKLNELEFHCSDDYLKVKTTLQQLGELLPKLKQVSEYNVKRVPFLFRFTFNQMQKLSSTLLTYEGWLKSRMNHLNAPQFKSGSTYVKFKSEDELWKKRNHAYQYWM